jgi:hypothetical protein
MPQSPPDSEMTPRTLATASLPRRVHAVLEHALALISEELDPSLHTLLDEFEQELFRLADLARNPGIESAYMQTLRTFRLNRADLVPHFMLELEAGVAGIRQPGGNPVDAGLGVSAGVDFPSLSLVEQIPLDEDAVLREIATRHEGRASLPLHLLGQRFGVLAGTSALDAGRIPLGPQAVCRALRTATRGLQIDLDARVLLYRMFDRHVMVGFTRVMEKLDEMISGDGVLPGLTYVPLRVRPTPQGSQIEDGGEPDSSADAEDHDAGTGTAAAGPSTRQAPGRRPARRPAATAQPALDPMRPHTAWMGEPAGADDDGDTDAAYASLQTLMAGRRALIGKLRPTRPANPQDQLESTDLDRALGHLQTQPGSAVGSSRSFADVKQILLAQMRQQYGRGAALTQEDDDTFELMHMLYSQLEGEINANAPAAALVRRLQLPLLRVALQDNTFFVRSEHPARQLLNTVAESAARWLDAEDFDPQLLLPLQTAVTDVVQRYDGDTGIFEQNNQKLQAAMQAQTNKAELLERRHVEAARGKEKLEVAKQRSATALAELIGEHRLPKFTRALLNQAWADVLTLTLLRHGEESAQWREQLEATRRIITACSRPDGAVDQALTHHVETALNQVGYHGEEAGVIAQRLTRNIPEDEDDPASRTELAMKVKARVRLGEQSTRTRKSNLPPRTPEEQQRYEQLKVMPFGAWIEFTVNQQGDVVRRRMSWYSPLTDNALFVNQRGQRVNEVSLDGLARMLANGQARIVTADRGRIVDRAWQAAVSALRSFASRGDSPSPEGAPA